MPIEFACHKCGALNSRPFTGAGKPTSCDRCGAPAVVPTHYDASQVRPRQVKPESFSPGSAPSNEVLSPAGTLRSDPGARAASSLRAQSLPRTQGNSQAIGIVSTVELLPEEIFTQGYHIFRTAMRRYLLVFWAAALFTMGAQKALTAGLASVGSAQGSRVATVVVPLAAVILYWIVTLWIWCGTILFMLKASRGQNPSIATMVLGWRSVPSAFIATLVLELAMLLVLFGFLLPVAGVWLLWHDPQMTIVAGALCALPAMAVLMWLSLTFSQYLYVIVDRGAGPLQALAASYRLTAGNKVALFVLYVAALVSPLAVCACGIGLVF